MARNRSRGTLVDYLIVAIEPALIMVMVGSLMFFLLDAWCDSEVLDRFRYILFWFVFGIVLITRIGMQVGGDQAKAYGLALGGAVALVATVLGGFQPVLLITMGVVWWATHKLTYDCTLVDEDQDAGVGLLQDSGLDTSALAEAGLDDMEDTTAKSSDDPEAMEASLMPDRPKWKFWGRDTDEARRPHAPGVWLIYFTIASLPLFGLTQLLVSGVEEDRRTWMFIYFLAYIASAMGLLLGTSFLNLRRYLRRRKLKMPAAMTATWLSTGAILIVGLTLAAAVLPLPLSAMRTARASAPKSSNLRASKYAILKDSGVQGEGARSEGKAASKAAGKSPSSGKTQGSGKTNDPNASQQVNGQGRQGGQGGQGRSKSGAPKGKPSSSQGGQQGKNGAPQDQSGDQAKGRDQSGDQAKGEDQAKGQKGRSEQQAEGQEKAESGDQKGSEKGEDKGSEKGEDKGSEKGDEKASQENEGQGDSSSPTPSLPSLPIPPLDWLQTPVMVVGIIILIYGLVRYGPDFFQAIMALLAGLFGFDWGKKPPKVDADVADEQAPPPRPFSSYANPFGAGLDHQLTPDDLIMYSFEAFEAWAYEHELARLPHETPMEFASRVGQERTALGPDAARLVGYFGSIVYGQQKFGSEVLPPLRRFWQALETSGGAVVDEPVTAS
jgi:chromate transport protein ChrA